MPKFMAISKELVFGVWPTAGGTWSPEFIDIITSGISPDRGWIDIESAGFRVKPMRIPGGFKSAGDLDMLSNCENITKILYGLLGEQVATYPKAYDTTCYEHYWKPPKDAIPSFAIEINPEVGGLSKLLLGCAIKALTIECPAREVVSFTPTILAAKEIIKTKTVFGSFTQARPLVFYEANMTIAGKTTFKVPSFSVTFENDIPDDAFVLGTQYLPNILLQGLDITGTMDVRMEDWELYKRMFGSETAKEPSTSPESISLIADIIGQVISGAYKYELKITLPAIRLNTAEANIDRRAGMIYTLPFEAEYHPGTACIAEVLVRNTKNLA